MYMSWYERTAPDFGGREGVRNGEGPGDEKQKTKVDNSTEESK